VKRTLTSVVLGGAVEGVKQASEVGCEADWMIEWATAGLGGPWKSFPGGAGTVTLGNAAAPFETAELTGLEPETPYYLRGTLEEDFGTFEAKLLRPDNRGIDVDPAHTGESAARVKGSLLPAPFETKWRIEYSASQTTLDSGGGTVLSEGTVSQAEAEALQTATGANPVFPESDISGLSPSTQYFVRFVAEDEPEWPPKSGMKHHKVVVSPDAQFETHGPPVAEASGTPALRLETLRVLGYVVPHGFDTHYRFQYGPTTAYGSETPEADAGSGGASGIEAVAAAADLPGLSPGQTYHYRIVASSASGGGATVHGVDHILAVPVPGEGAGTNEEASRPCVNEALRTGPSARLPDCRAYEQVTPVDKGGAQQAVSYGNQVEFGALVGEDGNHLAFEHLLVHWGSGQAPYFFSRQEGGGWQMTAGTAQPEAGFNHYEPELFNPDLTQFAFSSEWHTGRAESPNREFKAGLPGGPYPTVASVPRVQVGVPQRSGWVAASGDFSKRILMVEDRTVCGHPTGTTSGSDLYEFVEGRCSQVNVKSDGSPVGACGATMVSGLRRAEGPTTQQTSARDAVSRDGTHVFFEAVPGGSCSAASHVYVRLGGVTTVDIGAYSFVAANADGDQVLLEARNGAAQQLVLYDANTGTGRVLLTLHEPFSGAQQLHVHVSEDFSTIYLESTEQLTPDASPISDAHNIDLYRYDVGSAALRYIAQVEAPKEFGVTPDGRYAQWRGIVAGLPFGDWLREDAIRYDGVRGVVECVSCASALNPGYPWRPHTGAEAECWNRGMVRREPRCCQSTVRVCSSTPPRRCSRRISTAKAPSLQAAGQDRGGRRPLMCTNGAQTALKAARTCRAASR
jgi:hypothetical protein